MHIPGFCYSTMKIFPSNQPGIVFIRILTAVCYEQSRFWDFEKMR